MTKKDFILLAEVMIQAFQEADGMHDHVDRDVIDQVVYLMAGKLESAFPRFDRMKFINYIDQRKWT